MELKNNKLLRQQAFINGQWVTADSQKTFTVYNPFDQHPLAELPEMGAVETEQAIAAANSAFPKWQAVTPEERAQLFNRWSQLIFDNLEDLAVLLTCEQGKPLAQARVEVEITANRVAFFAGEILRITGQTLPSIAPDKCSLVIRQPYGVVAGVAPWNYPALTASGKMVPALAAGNCVVVKPAEDTPLTPLALVYLAEQAGFPPGVLNMVVAQQPQAIGEVLTTHEKVRMFSFTGSTVVGKTLYGQCASTVKQVILELGGNSPFIVFPDADLDAAAQQGAALKFANCGQICVNANRFFIHESVFDEFLAKFVAHAKAMVLGSGLEEQTTLGPLINAKHLAKVESLVAAAIKDGAKVELGGKKSEVGALFYEPTVLTNVNENMRIYQEEIFGPVAPLYKFNDEDEVITKANDTEYGLAAYFYTKDLGRAWRVSTALESGGVCVNAAGSFGGGPFGGFKQSGVGRESGRVAALDAYCETKTISIAGLGK